jgi:hypothetical protein
MSALHALAIIVAGVLAAVPAFADTRVEVKAIFAQDMATIDLARAKLELDRLVMPSVDVDAEPAQIDAMATELAAMIPAGQMPGRRSRSCGAPLRGRAMGRQPPFAYDMTDPCGRISENKLLSDYLDDRRGNCVTMPLLMIVLGIGLDLTADGAPLHVLITRSAIGSRAWARLRNRVSFKNSSRILPLKLSAKPFRIGLPGAMQCRSTLCPAHHSRIASDVSSAPLSETIIPGFPRRSIRAVSSRAARRPEIDVSGIAARHFPCHVINHVQHPKAPPAGELEVEWPARIGPCLDQDRGPCADGLAARFAFTDG